MKCPNCSFVNTDDNKTCRVCGFELASISNEIPTPAESDTKISKRRMIDDSEDEVLDSAFKSIFETDKDFEEPEAAPSSKIEPIYEPISRKRILIMLILLGVLLLLIALKFLWSGLPWTYDSHFETTESVEIASTEIENTTESALTLGDEPSLEPVNAFFNQLPEFINRGNLSILHLFDNSQEALDVLTSFAVIGNLEKVAEATLTESEVTLDSATYKVTTLTNRLIEGQQTQTASVWDFRSVLKNDQWILESISVETGIPVALENEITTEVTTEKQTVPTKESKAEPETTAEITTEATTEITTEKPAATLFKGYKSSGSFSGGEKASGQDVAFVRYGSHDTYERLAFDLYEWVGGKPNQPVDVITNYTASISGDGRTIGIMVNGAIEAFASQSPIDLKNSANIESVIYNYFGNGEVVAITINLNKKSQFKVFNLVSPAKLVIDIAPID